MNDVVETEPDAEWGTCTLRFDPDEPDALVTAVVEATARASGTDPLAMAPLTDTIDPEALGQLVRTTSADSVITFDYYGHEVTVRGDGLVTAAEA
ncbi:HalOD1 output domain-containing protein [Halobaculum marinum]|uniref:HalOD1 output domain-containing protein n=1 Tax=Halobaculum marinum TaxID=3031996 RepID=A0ABD5WVD8_9EURY|nr:HalOD1 output domain-containing protein [Halobaculum sp. DT55]